MASPSDVSPSTDDPAVTTEQPENSRPRPSRVNQALAWVGIVAGGLFIFAAIFFSGFFLSWNSGSPSGGHQGPSPMACCDEMKKGEPMKPGVMMAPGGQMKPGEMMPGGMMGPASQSPATTSPNAPRP
jgi:hypothetical protein